MDWIQDVWSIILIIVLIIGGFVYLRSSLTKQSHDELADLAETRGETIDDLRTELHELQAKVALLEGQMQAIQSIKAREIAVEVARFLRSDFTDADVPRGEYPPA